jgi:hypothetical protein
LFAGGTRSAITTATPGEDAAVRSGKVATHKPAGFAAAVSGGLAEAPESVRLEKRDGTHVTAGLVDPLAARVDRVAFRHGGAHRVRMSDRALHQLVHKAAAPEPGRTTKHTTDHAPSSWTCGIVRELTRARQVDFGATEHQPAVSLSTYASTPGPGSPAHSVRTCAIRLCMSRLELRYAMQTHPPPPSLRGTINDAKSSHRPVADSTWTPMRRG